MIFAAVTDGRAPRSRLEAFGATAAMVGFILYGALILIAERRTLQGAARLAHALRARLTASLLGLVVLSLGLVFWE